MESFSLKKLAIAALFVGLSTAQTSTRRSTSKPSTSTPAPSGSTTQTPPVNNVVIGGYNYVDGNGNTYLGSYNQNLGN
jgi:hypothetical protein